ncbi:MAG: phosphonate C-P lyase system protein PhnG [Synergistaceae bacterium]|jgi:alpha-D-ribose 1-methylphosphonate 5-triphosphate synthase subunit PhnG|nr:phosphonate C-P lyase system protein PhnG [Synergistaceae bacterium]
MDKMTLSRVSVFTDPARLDELAKRAASGRDILLLKKPEKTMILLMIREPVKGSRFYLGEALAAHCVVEIDGVRGASVQLGDDMGKTLSAAVLDAAHTGNFPGFEAVEAELMELDATRAAEAAGRASDVRSTQVRFHIMEGKEL